MFEEVPSPVTGRRLFQIGEDELVSIPATEVEETVAKYHLVANGDEDRYKAILYDIREWRNRPQAVEEDVEDRF